MGGEKRAYDGGGGKKNKKEILRQGESAVHRPPRSRSPPPPQKRGERDESGRRPLTSSALPSSCLQPKTLATIPYDAMGYIVTSDADRGRGTLGATPSATSTTRTSRSSPRRPPPPAAQSEKVADDSKDASDKLAAELAELKESGGDEAADSPGPRGSSTSAST